MQLYNFIHSLEMHSNEREEKCLNFLTFLWVFPPISHLGVCSKSLCFDHHHFCSYRTDWEN